jgi:hypothetical protein
MLILPESIVNPIDPFTACRSWELLTVRLVFKFTFTVVAIGPVLVALAILILVELPNGGKRELVLIDTGFEDDPILTTALPPPIIWWTSSELVRIVNRSEFTRSRSVISIEDIVNFPVVENLITDK